MPKNKSQKEVTETTNEKVKKAKKAKIKAEAANIVEGYLWDQQSGVKLDDISNTRVYLPGDTYCDRVRWPNREQYKKLSISNKPDSGWPTLEEAKGKLDEYINNIYGGEPDDGDSTYHLYRIRIERVATAKVKTHVQNDITLDDIAPTPKDAVIVVSSDTKKKKKKGKKAKVVPAVEVKKAEPTSEFVTPDLG